VTNQEELSQTHWSKCLSSFPDSDCPRPDSVHVSLDVPSDHCSHWIEQLLSRCHWQNTPATNVNGRSQVHVHERTVARSTSSFNWQLHCRRAQPGHGVTGPPASSPAWPQPVAAAANTVLRAPCEQKQSIQLRRAITPFVDNQWPSVNGNGKAPPPNLAYIASRKKNAYDANDYAALMLTVI